MTVCEFIQTVLIDEFKTLQQDEAHHTLSFSLICQGIEFLGACLDSEPFSAKGLSAPRFRKAIHELFPAFYHKFNQGSGRPFDLYENLRCGLWHVILPGSRLELIRRLQRGPSIANHLEVKEIRELNRLVLVLEDLFEDYENACKEIMARIGDGRLTGWKFAEDS